jgi:hypothetical protein
MSHSLTSSFSQQGGLVSHIREVEKILEAAKKDPNEVLPLLFRQLRKLQSILLQLESVCF